MNSKVEMWICSDGKADGSDAAKKSSKKIIINESFSMALVAFWLSPLVLMNSSDLKERTY